jgi:hypothetical protein
MQHLRPPHFQPSQQERAPATSSNRHADLSSQLQHRSRKTCNPDRELENRLVATRVAQCVSGGGRRSAHSELEARLYDWIVARNRKGLWVKYLYIRLQARNIDRELRGDDATEFEASSGWLVRFKARHSLVSCRETTFCTLPADAPEICHTFIQRVHHLIATHDMQPRNGINMDQVPRCFETEPKATITTRGSAKSCCAKAAPATSDSLRPSPSLVREIL